MLLLNQRTALLLAPALCWASVLGAQVPPTASGAKPDAEDQTCVVSGMVVAKADGSPLKGATVHLSSMDDREHTIADKTSADGRFTLKNVPAGKYSLKVSRNGYFDVEYGQKKPGDPGATLSLQRGQNVSDLQFKMGKAGVISGRIFDEDGQPMERVMVVALRNHYVEGHKELRVSTESESNDLGEFRLYGLSPGRYYVSADEPRWNHVVGEKEFTSVGKGADEKGHTKMYYPNAVDPDKASVVVVKEGEEVSSIDFLMKEVPVYRIAGRAVNLVSKHGTREIQILLTARNRENDYFGFGANSSVKSDGAFEIPEVAPGEYTVMAIVFEESKIYSAEQDVDVVSADVEGLSLSVNTGVTIPGRVSWEGKPNFEKEGMTVFLEPLQNRYGIGSKSAEVDENSQFALKEVADGTYKMHITGLSKDCYISEVKLGETELPDVELRVRGPGGNLELTVSSKGARIDGTVLNDDNLPVAGAWAVVIPEQQEKRKYMRLYKSSSTDQNGHFEIHGLAPGKYKLFSWDGVQAHAWEDPDFLKEYEDKGETIDVQNEDQKTVTLKVIPAKGS
jgi:hypothetical protein